jgi:hypothetical protein
LQAGLGGDDAGSVVEHSVHGELLKEKMGEKKPAEAGFLR